jgi:hypothetical protein
VTGSTASGDSAVPLLGGDCWEDIDALYVLAYLYSGDRCIAEEAVVEAVANVFVDPVAVVGGRNWLWQIMAANIRTQCEKGLLRGTLCVGAVSDAQRQCIALIAVGRNVLEAAALLDTTVAQVRHDTHAGIRAFQLALGLQAGSAVGASSAGRSPSRRGRLPRCRSSSFRTRL